MLKLITWNIQCARTPDGSADLDAVVERLATFSDFDVLCLQEVSCGSFDPPSARGANAGIDQFAGLARRLPGCQAASALALDTPDADGAPRQLGNMLFSRHPILQVLRHSLPWPADPEVPSMPRCALEVTLATPIGLLRVLSVHLEYFSARQRLAQVEHLRALHTEACSQARAPRLSTAGPFTSIPRPAAAILAGDFNMLPDSQAHRRLLSAFDDGIAPVRDAWQLLRPGSTHAPTVGLHDNSPDASPPFTFDYAFVSADLAHRVRELRVDVRAGGSAHQPVLLELA